MNATAPSRNPWPIAIVAYFIVFIAFIVTFTVFAARQHVDLVSADYYEQEIHFQKQIDRLSRTQPIQAQVAITYDAARQQISIALPPGQDHRRTSGQVRFYRPSDAAIDRTLPLDLNPDGAQLVNVKPLLSGLWKVRVQWTIEGQDYYFDQPIVVTEHN